MDDRAGDGKTGKLFERFIEDVAGVEVGGDEDVGTALEDATRGLFKGDVRVDGGIELHFAVDEIVGVGLADVVDGKSDFFEVGVFTTGAVGRVREHGDAGLFVVVGDEGSGGVFDDSAELFFGGLFVDAAVGDSEMVIATFADETTREKRGF